LRSTSVSAPSAPLPGSPLGVPRDLEKIDMAMAEGL
jgi:hypothetical protein